MSRRLLTLFCCLFGCLFSSLLINIPSGHATAQDYLFFGKDTVVNLSPNVSVWEVCQRAKTLAETHLRREILQTVSLSLPPIMTFPITTMTYTDRRCTVTVSFHYARHHQPPPPLTNGTHPIVFSSR